MMSDTWRPPIVRLSFDWASSGLWAPNHSDWTVLGGMIEPETLDLPADLAKRIERWVDNLDRRDPWDELTADEASCSQSEGLNIVLALSVHLGSDTLVQFEVGDWALGFRFGHCVQVVQMKSPLDHQYPPHHPGG